MKVIDLLNKIANGEEVPKQISIDKDIYEWDSLERFYSNQNGEDLLNISMVYCTPDFLETEIELIEDQTIDIENLGELVRFSSFDEDNNLQIINTIIDEQNKIKRAIKHLNKEIQSIKEK